MITKEQSRELKDLIAIMVVAKARHELSCCAEDIRENGEALLNAQLSLHRFIESITEEA